MKNSKGIKGITLIALAITIIILLILAGVTISSLTGNGIFGKIGQAKEKNDEGTVREIIITKIYDYQMESIHNNKKETLEGLNEYLQNDKEIEYIDLYIQKDNLEIPEEGETATHAKIKLKKYKYEYLLDQNLNIIQNVETKSRKYLYKEGEEYTKLTGGWNVEYFDGDNSSVGTAKKHDNYIEIQTWGYWCAYRCITQNTIDLSEYSKLKADIECNWTDVSGGYEQIGLKAGNNEIVWHRVDLQDKIYTIDINTKENANIQITAGNGANIKIKSIWLEK